MGTRTVQSLSHPLLLPLRAAVNSLWCMQTERHPLQQHCYMGLQYTYLLQYAMYKFISTAVLHNTPHLLQYT